MEGFLNLVENLGFNTTPTHRIGFALPGDFFLKQGNKTYSNLDGKFYWKDLRVSLEPQGQEE